MRILSDRLSKMRDVVVGVIQRPQSRIADFYREIGEIFGVNLAPHNRWCGFKALREKWKAHLETSLTRPVLLVDEAQEACIDVLSELRIISSANFDSSLLLTVVIAGDGRLQRLMFRCPDCGKCHAATSTYQNLARCFHCKRHRH